MNRIFQVLIVTGLVVAVGVVLASKRSGDTCPIVRVSDSVSAANSADAGGSGQTAPGVAHGSAGDAVPSPTTAPSAVPRLLELGSDRCIPCRAMVPVLDGLRRDFAGRLQVDFIDVWKDQSAGQRYGVSTIPTQVFFSSDGRELARHVGFFSRDDILAKWKELGIELKS